MITIAKVILSRRSCSSSFFNTAAMRRGEITVRALVLR